MVEFLAGHGRHGLVDDSAWWAWAQLPQRIHPHLVGSPRHSLRSSHHGCHRESDPQDLSSSVIAASVGADGARHPLAAGWLPRMWTTSCPASSTHIQTCNEVRPHGDGPRQKLRSHHLMILVTRPAPTVRPPSRMANLSCSSMAIGWIRWTVMSVLSPGITISVPSGSSTVPVTSVVRK